LIDRWNSLSANEVSSLDISTEMSNLTLDIIGQSAFAYEMNAVDDSEGTMSNWCKTVMETFTLNFWILLPGYRKLPTPGNRKLKDSIYNVESVIMKTIREKHTKLASGEKSPMIDLLDLLLETKDENGVVFTDHQILNHAMTFMLAGHETTSAALSWLFYLLSQHPEVEAKLAEEVKVFKDRSDFSIEELEKLPYLENVIKETLRLYPPAPITIRVAIQDDNIGGYHIPAGSKVLISSGVIHRLEKYWGPTARQFDPDRWDTPHVKELPHHLYFPFLMGPRSCIGAKFARLEMKVIIVMLLNHFSLKLVPGSSFRPVLTLTQKPCPSLPMKVLSRS
jgi:cytochrome P450